jgi:hypothetical protein
MPRHLQTSKPLVDANLNLELVFNLLIFKINIYALISSGTRLCTQKMRVLLILCDTIIKQVAEKTAINAAFYSSQYPLGFSY